MFEICRIERFILRVKKVQFYEVFAGLFHVESKDVEKLRKNWDQYKRKVLVL